MGAEGRNIRNLLPPHSSIEIGREPLTALDSVLLAQAREYDTQALAEIYDRYADRIYKYLYRHLGDAAQAEDLTSEVFLRLLQVLNTARAPRDHLLGWLYRVASNLATDWFRQQAKGSTVSLLEELVADEHSPLAALEKHEVRWRLRRAIGQLTSSQQQVILLRFGEGLRLAEIGQLMGKSEGAIKVLQHRAIRRLGKLLEREEKQVHEKMQGRPIRQSAAPLGARREN
jgi:RNA polymerase sigma-70 factor (ECF subfamily)